VVVAIDDAEQSLHLVRLLQQYFGHVRIVARARDALHAIRSQFEQEMQSPATFCARSSKDDLEKGTYASAAGLENGSPGDAAHHAAGQPDPAKIRTRFPPEPNGYLHVGHAKSICLNFGLARDYGGVCHLRFDDTNPEKEDTEYVNSIIDAVQWLGFDWACQRPGNYSPSLPGQRLLRLHVPRSGIFDRSGPRLRGRTNARANARQPGRLWQTRCRQPLPQPHPAENLARFREMRDGQHEDGAMVLRAKIDMASPNINMRDPAIYRIRRATHHNTGDKWCIYPMYTFAHPIEDALEQITHSICTLEFEDQRPFYDWLMDRLCEGGLLAAPAPHQYEFARLNLTYVITSKRKLAATGVRPQRSTAGTTRACPPSSACAAVATPPPACKLFAERIGVTKSDSWIDYSTLEGCLREDLELKAHRGIAVLNPVKLVLTNWDEVWARATWSPAPSPPCPTRKCGDRRRSATPDSASAPLHHRQRSVDRARRL
jgi:glutaminyl-tRNA synthetase